MDREREHAFSIELTSKEHLKRVTLGNRSDEQVVIEGFLGELLTLNLVEESMFELVGTNGIFRLDIRGEELSKFIKGTKKCQKNK